MTHKQALILILRILRDFQPDWPEQVQLVVQQLDDWHSVKIDAGLSTSARMSHREAIIRILRILQTLPALPDNWSEQVWRVVQQLGDPDVEFCLVHVAFDPLPKQSEDIWNPNTYNKEPKA